MFFFVHLPLTFHQFIGPAKKGVTENFFMYVSVTPPPPVFREGGRSHGEKKLRLFSISLYSASFRGIYIQLNSQNLVRAKNQPLKKEGTKNQPGERR